MISSLNGSLDQEIVSCADNLTYEKTRMIINNADTLAFIYAPIGICCNVKKGIEWLE
jgi:hypothetical protein